ncbi:PPA1309 family protein [Cellulomonas carbonis]|uniref:Uncharacterized protein n=1 Tax=Cellulomonas carbonis T26 TaxID=947969 RepID=A0A0A0BY13_9CELL|nr:PPA1309 family protein [Cellulomonas carbonis]KGM12796.1 hypothetical protein N868_00600 [Cellulomonas carbonis T26]GGC14706.1 hypothetical protein GCM10010972_29990 [Cellulomonas carbonis]
MTDATQPAPHEEPHDERQDEQTGATAPDPATAHLATSVREIERHVAGGGWDGPVRVFALVSTAAALEAEPGLAAQLAPEVVDAARGDEHHLTSVEQEGLPQVESLEELLGILTWPDTVAGAAVVVERVVLPSAAEDAMPADPDEALAYLMGHPDRQDVRIAVGALRTGETWSVLRTRAHDDDAAVAGGPDLVPGLTEAIRATFL